MSWYYGTFSCGCEGRVNVVGKEKDRQWKVDRAFSNVCEDCYRKEREEKIAKENAEALEQAKEMELPELTGTEKQVGWANTLRNKILNQLSELRSGIISSDEDSIDDAIYYLEIDKDKYEKKELLNILVDYLDKFEELFLLNTKASYFIDNRTRDLDGLILKNIDEIKNADKIKEEKELKLEIIKETTVEPEEVKFDDVVELVASKDTIKVYYHKNQTFIDIVKSLEYKWENGCWQKSINELTGSYIDRAAEVANELLNSGFRVAIPELEIKEKALNATYEQECNRWIKHEVYTTKMHIKWYGGRNEDLYNASRKLKGSKWNNSNRTVEIDAKHFGELEEFADMYGFRFTEVARKFLDKYKIEYEKQMSNIEKVEVKGVKNVKEKNGLEDILNSSREVLNDLVEED